MQMSLNSLYRGDLESTKTLLLRAEATIVDACSRAWRWHQPKMGYDLAG
jgi:hypothetical protein